MTEFDDLPVLARWLLRRSNATPAQVAVWLASHADRARLVAVDETMREAARDLRVWAAAVDLYALPVDDVQEARA